MHDSDATAYEAPNPTIDQVRDTLLALGANELSDSVVQYRWPDRLKDGTYEYGVSALEVATCKNGKVYVDWHHGVFTEGGSQWPDALEMKVEEEAVGQWGVNYGEKCKGTSKITVAMTPEPLADDAALDEFMKTHAKAFKQASKEAKKAQDLEKDPGAF